MADEKSNKKYQSRPIPGPRLQADPKLSQPVLLPDQAPVQPSPFYELEYDSDPVPGVGRYVLQAQRIVSRPREKHEELFAKMRDIARLDRGGFDFNRSFTAPAQDSQGRIFYKQAVFMVDFTDDYTGQADFSQYFPFYQKMNYAQLRSYFTWRSQVRQGQVEPTSLSYAFLYIYELINNIGVADPQDGLSRLLAFWQAFREHNTTISKYLTAWLKDYHIYYGLMPVFPDYAPTSAYYAEEPARDFQLELLSNASSYKIKNSKFYTEKTRPMLADCLVHCTKYLAKEFATHAADLQDFLFSPAKRVVIWRPFKNALFFDWRKQADRLLVLPKEGVYRCVNNKWTYSPLLAGESGRRFIGFYLKQLEASLRQLTGYKYKMTAQTSLLQDETIAQLRQKGLAIRELITAAVQDYWQKAQQTVVEIDHSSLEKLRQDAQITQAALTVPDVLEEEEIKPPPDLPEPFFSSSPPGAGGWQELKEALSQTELKALSVSLQNKNLKTFADDQGVMLEVLLDNINQKALDHVGDNLYDEDLILYDDYLANIKDMVD